MAKNFAVVPSSGIAPDRMYTTQETVLTIARDVLGKPDLGPEDDLFDHGATSLSFVRVLAQIRQELQVMVRAADLDGEVTARKMTVCIEKSKES